MDLKLKEITWVRLMSLLLWTILVMIKRGVSQLIEIVESRVFDVSSQTPEKRSKEGEKELETLLPPLTDELVLTQIWPLLHQRVNVSLLWRLRRVNKAWRDKVSTTMEWAALEMVRVDSPGFLQFITERCERRPSLRERVESELKFFAILLAERLGESTARSELGEPGSDRLGPVRSRESREQKEPVSEELEAEVSSNNCHVCRKV